MDRNDRRRIGAVIALVVASAFWGLSANARSEEFSFVVVGHLRGEQDDEQFFLMDELVERVASLKPNIVFLTGDLIFGDWHRRRVDKNRIIAHWDRLDRSLARIGSTVYRVPGNHDINDPVTRDIWFQRYGKPPQAISFAGSRFLLLATPFIPVGNNPPEIPRPHGRVEDLPEDQIDFIRRELERADDYHHVFLFMHHVVWWEPERKWWTKVHPLLVGRHVRAVFAGDYGPLKFSHMRRDEIDYFQSALERRAPARLVRDKLGLGRVVNHQFDSFLYVQVRDERVDVEVKVIGATSSGKHTPERFRELLQSAPTREPRRGRRLPVVAALIALGFAGGVAATWIVARLRRRI